MVGIDPDFKRVEVAREKYSADNTDYLEGSAENITGHDYDMVYSNHVLHWCKDKNLVFDNVYKCLKQGGKFGFIAATYFDIIQTFFTSSDMVTSEFIEFSLNKLFLLTLEEFNTLASQNNFKVLYMEEDTRDWIFEDVHKLIGFHMVTQSHGKFDSTHFNVDAMKRHYGEGKITITLPFITAILCKT